jgi:hypothetical protein
MTRRSSRSAAMVLLFSPFLAALIESACTQPSTGSGASAPPAAPARSATSDAYTPGLGEIMTLQQMRHVKLWLAGEADNWDLAAYEIKELGEGFDDVVKFHPTHEDSPVAPKDAIPRMMTGPLSDVQTAIAKKDVRSFEQAYDALTKACNSCHQATNFTFNVVQRPAMNPYPNQSFAPVAK